MSLVSRKPVLGISDRGRHKPTCIAIEAILRVEILAIETKGTTVKFQNFRTPENFAVIYLKFKQIGKTLGFFVKKMQME